MPWRTLGPRQAGHLVARPDFIERWSVSAVHAAVAQHAQRPVRSGSPVRQLRADVGHGTRDRRRASSLFDVSGSIEPRDRAQQAPRVGMARAPGTVRDAALLDDLRPAYMTTTSLARLGHHAQIVRDQHDRHAQLCAAARVSSSRICAWIVTSSAVVGSSAISSSGLHDERHRDHHALPHAAGELVRIVASTRSLGDRDPDAARASRSRSRQRVALRSSLRCSRTASAICSPTVNTGFSEVIGSWKIIAIRLPRIWRISSCGQLEQVLARRA